MARDAAPPPLDARPATAVAPGVVPAPRRWWPRVLLAAHLALVAFLPFAASPVFPSHDGPAHLDTAATLALLREGRAPVAASLLVETDPGPSNAFVPWTLSRLLEVTGPVEAEWGVAFALTALLLGAVLLPLRLLRRDGTEGAAGGRAAGPWDAALGALLCAPVLLYMGSFSLVLGYALGFAGLAFAAAYLDRGRGWHLALFPVLALAACTLGNAQVAVPVVAAAFGGAGCVVAWGWLRRDRLRGPPVVPHRLLMLCLATLPVVAFAVLYKLRVPGGQLAASMSRWPTRQAELLVGRGDVAWFWWGDPLLLGAVGLAGVAAVGWWVLLGPAPAARPASGDGRLAADWAAWAALPVAVLAVVLPYSTMAVPMIPQRLGAFAHFLVFLWFVAAPVPPWLRRGVVALAVVAGLAHAAGRTHGHVALDDRVAELAWAERQVPDGSLADLVLLYWALGEEAPSNVVAGVELEFSPYAHLGRGLAGRDVVALSNVQYHTHWNIFRLRLRPDLAGRFGVHRPGDPPYETAFLFDAVANPHLHGGLGRHVDRVEAATGHRLETVIVWDGGLDAAAVARRDARIARMREELEARYDLAGRSAPRGYAEVWRRKPPTAGPATSPDPTPSVR